MLARMTTFALALFAALAGTTAEQRTSQAPAAPRAYIENAADEAVRFAGSQARVVSIQGGALGRGGFIVCGTLTAGDEALPFATVWGAGQQADAGATLVGMRRSDRLKYRRGMAFHRSIGSVCRDAGLAHYLPPETAVR